MSNKVRRAFNRVRPIAQTIAAIASTIVGIVRILKAFGLLKVREEEGGRCQAVPFFLLPHGSKPYTCTSILTYRQSVVKT